MTERVRGALTVLLSAHRPEPGRRAHILSALLAVQEAFGYVQAEAVPLIADALAVTEADVAGVLSYYPDLYSVPRGRHVVRVCLGEACVANRSAALLESLCHDVGAGLGQTTSDGRLTIERVYCLGNCAVGPTVMADEQIYGRVGPEELHTILQSHP
ncbi:MAG: NAD(P)H-dependent oxidoreductase subunit E [Nitrospira sp.]